MGTGLVNMAFQCIDQAVVTVPEAQAAAECMREPSEQASCIHRDANTKSLFEVRDGERGAVEWGRQQLADGVI